VWSSQDLRFYISAALAPCHETVILSMDHLEALPHYVAKALLRCLRVAYNERATHPEYERLVVIAAGALNLFKLTISLVSPFNIATFVSIPDADEGQSRALIDRVASHLDVTFSRDAVQNILAEAGGDRYLIQRLCRAAAGQPHRAGRVTATAVARAVAAIEQREPLDDPCLAERIRLVEADADTLKTVLEVLAGREVRRRELLTDVDSAELTGAVRMRGHRYAARTPLCSRLLQRYFTPDRVAGLFSTFGRWDEAIRYFEQGNPAADRLTRSAYLEAVISRIYQDEEEEEPESFEAIATALARAFEATQLVIHRHLADQDTLVASASRGVSGAEYPAVISRSGVPDSPQARALGDDDYWLEDYLLEKDERGRSLLVFGMPSGSRLPAAGVATLIDYFPAEQHAEHREQVLQIAAFLARAGRAIASQRERTWLLQQERRRAEGFAILGSVPRDIAQVQDPADLLRRIVQTARQVLNAHAVTMYLYNAKTGQFHSPLGDGLWHEPEFLSDPPPELSGKIAGRIVRECEPMFFEEARQHPAAEHIPLIRREAIQSGAGFPLLLGTKPLGVIFVGYRTAHSFAASERKLISAFAQQAAIAIESAWVYQELTLDRTMLAGLFQVSTRLRASLDLMEVLDTITTSLRMIYGLATCTVGLSDEDEKRLDFVAHSGLLRPVARNIPDLPADLWNQLRAGRYLFVADLAARPDLARVLERHDLTSFAAWPLHGRERFLGILTLSSTQSLQLSDLDFGQITALANQAAIAIENAQLHARLSRTNKELIDWVNLLAHQLSAEPAFVSNTLSILLAGKLGDLSEEQRDRLAKAQRRLDQHHHLIESLNLYGRIMGGKVVPHLEKCSLRRLIQSIAGEYEHRAQRQGLSLELDLGQMPAVYVDEGLLRIVLANLLENAIKFTPQDGRVCIESWADERGTHMAVDDTGLGIPPEHWEKVFDVYFQVRPEDQQAGAGLGLYIVRRLVHMLGGTVAVTPKAGPGTRIEVVLPAGTPDGEAVMSRKAGTSLPRRRKDVEAPGH